MARSKVSEVTPLAFDLRTAAAKLGIGRTHLRKLLKSGSIHSVRAGAKILVPSTAIDEFLAGGKAS